MRAISMISALALGIALAQPAAAGFFISAQIGGSGYSGSGHITSGRGSAGYGVAIGKGSGAYRYEGRRYHRPRRRSYGSIYLIDRRYDDRVRYRQEPATPAAPPPEPDPPVAVTPAEPPAPPDPWGPLRSNSARGVLPAEPAYKVGEALPPSLPHVTLDWRQFELPEPPAGQIYARVKRDVLLITAVGRIVESVVPPG